MSWLSIVLVIKIAVTGASVAVPLLVLPTPRLQALSGFRAETPVLLRLYGAAIAALLVGYGAGIPAAEQQVFPWGVTLMGTVSNGAAALLLYPARQIRFHRSLAIFFAGITAALIAAMVRPELALQPAW